MMLLDEKLLYQELIIYGKIRKHEHGRNEFIVILLEGV